MKKKKITLNEEISQIKRMMKKINEGMYDSRGNFKGGPDPNEDNYNDEEMSVEASEFIDDVYNFIKNNHSDLFDKLDITDDIVTKKDYDDFEEYVKIEISMKDGSELSHEFMNSLAKEFYNDDSPDAYEELLTINNSAIISRKFFIPGPDFD